MLSIRRNSLTPLLAIWTSVQLATSWDLKPSAEKYWNLKKLGLLSQREPIMSTGHEIALQQPEQSSAYHAYYYSHNPHQSFSRHQHDPEIEGRSVSSSPSKYSSTITSNGRKVDRNVESLKAQSFSGCTYKGQRYYHSQSVSTNQPCLNCTCQRGFVSCYLRVCPTIKPPEGDDSCFLLKEEANCCATLKCSSTASSSHDTYDTVSSSTADSIVNSSAIATKYVKSSAGAIEMNNTLESTSSAPASSNTTASPVDAMTPVASPYTSFNHKSTYHANNAHERRAESPSYASYNRLYPLKVKDAHHTHATLQPPYKQETTYWSSHSPRPLFSSTVSPLRSSFRPYFNQMTARPYRPYAPSSSTPSPSSSTSGYSRKPIHNDSFKGYPPNVTLSHRRPLYPVTSTMSSTTSSTSSSVNSPRQTQLSSSYTHRRPISSSSLVASSSTSPVVAANHNKLKNKISNDFLASSTTTNNLPVSVSSVSSKNAYKDSPNDAFSFFRLSSLLV